jgi:hypothetical protein
VIRAFVLYDDEPDPDRYARHVDLCRRVRGGTFRHGRIFAAPRGEPAFRYYAEWEFQSREAFDEAARSPEFMATGKDAMEMGGKMQVLFAELADG